MPVVLILLAVVMLPVAFLVDNASQKGEYNGASFLGIALIVGAMVLTIYTSPSRRKP